MLRRLVLALLLVALVSGCAPFGAAPTPTLAPRVLADQSLQQAAVAAVDQYAKRLGYPHSTPSVDLISQSAGEAYVHITVGFQTRKDFPYEDHDALVTLRKTGDSWQAEPIKDFTKLAWEVDLKRGPATLSSAAGFTVKIPEGWVGYAAGQSELITTSVCGDGLEARTSSVVLLAMPAGYSADNVPIVLRGFQQCPRQPSLGIIRQRYEDIAKSDASLKFDRLELGTLAGKTAVVAFVTDENGSQLFEYVVQHKDRQLEFVLQARVGQDLTKVMDVLTSLQFN